MFDFDPNAVIKDLTNEQINKMETLIDCFTADPLANPLHVQHLITESMYADFRGKVAYALLGLYAIGKIEWSPGDPWTGSPGGWVPKDKNKKDDYSIN